MLQFIEPESGQGKSSKTTSQESAAKLLSQSFILRGFQRTPPWREFGKFTRWRYVAGIWGGLQRRTSQRQGFILAFSWSWLGLRAAFAVAGRIRRG